MHQSKFLKTIFLTLLLLWSTANAQEPRSGEHPEKTTEEIPELQEWWRAPANLEGFGRSISFLPNFYEGKNVIVISVPDPVFPFGQKHFHTYLNQFPGDTQNVFTWKAGYIKSGDFNGDGIIDYIDGTGNIYRGIQNGMPPEAEPVKNYGISGQVFDLNNDGYDDVYSNNVTSVAVLYGGADLADLKAESVDQWPLGNNTSIEAIYRTPQGEFRLVIYRYEKDSIDGFELYRVTWQKGSMKPEFERLDSILKYPDFQQKRFYMQGSGEIYQSKHHGKTYLFVKELIDNNVTKNNVVIYDVMNDKFTESLRFRIDGGLSIKTLNQSIDGDEYEDWTIHSKGFRYFLSGGTTLDSIIRFKYKGDCFGGNLIEPIGDINEDGINDLMISTDANGVPNCFRIVKGMGLPNGIQTDEHKTISFSLSEPTPNPLHSTGAISATITKAGKYTVAIYSVDGRNITQLFDKFFDIGTHIIPLNLAPYGLSSGTYLLCLSNGTQSVERTIIISK